jgi:hypothetical protein
MAHGVFHSWNSSSSSRLCGIAPFELSNLGSAACTRTRCDRADRQVKEPTGGAADRRPVVMSIGAAIVELADAGSQPHDLPCEQQGFAASMAWTTSSSGRRGRGADPRARGALAWGGRSGAMGRRTPVAAWLRRRRGLYPEAVAPSLL